MWGHDSQNYPHVDAQSPMCSSIPSAGSSMGPHALGTQGTLVLSHATPVCWILGHFYGWDPDPCGHH